MTSDDALALASEAGLVYVEAGAPGLKRLGHGRGFTYLDAAGGNVQPAAGQVVQLPPGSYDTVRMNPGAVVQLVPGRYYVRTLVLDTNAELRLGGNGDPGVTVSANAEVGDHVGAVEAAVEGDGTTIAFNARYLADVLTNVDADQFALELNGPLSPGEFKPVGDDQYVHVVMPVRTTS